VLKDELRKARIAAGLTQERLAAKANISREMVNYIERGKSKPTVDLFIKLCNGMGVYAPDLLKRVVPRLKSSGTRRR
jgi:transcriptional regulator with XRE-family HTH domain